MTDLKNYEEEIIYREQILQKVRNGIKPTPAERIWAVTHPVYNRRLGFPFFNVAIESFEPNKWYLLRIKVEAIAYDDRIIPIIYVPAGKGRIITDFELEDISGNVSRGVPVKMLGLESKQHQNSEVKYLSKLGLLSVSYGCDYFDEKPNLHKRESSSTGNPDFAMIRQIVNEHMVRYRCKSPVGDSFDAMVFTIEWIEDRGG